MDIQIRPKLPCLHETGDMVPMLMGDHKKVDAAAGRSRDVAHHGVHDELRFRGAQNDSTIDQKVERLFLLSRKSEQEAVAEALAIETKRDAARRRAQPSFIVRDIAVHSSSQARGADRCRIANGSPCSPARPK